MSSPPRRAALVFIVITVVLDFLALGVIVPVLPTLVVDFLHGDTARAAEVYGLFGTVWALMQFVFSPVLGRALRPLRPAAGDPDLQLRPRPRLHRHGAGAVAHLAVRRPRALGHHRGELLDGDGLHHRRRTAGPASPRIRPARRRLRFRLHHRPGRRRSARHHRAAAALLVRRRAQPRQLRLRPRWCCRSRCRSSAGRRSGGAARTRSARWRCCARIPSCSASRRRTSSTSSPTTCCRARFVLYSTYRYGWTRARGRLSHGRHRRVRHDRPGGAGAAGGGAARRAAGPARRAALRAIAFTLYGLVPRGALLSLGVPLQSLWGLSSVAAQGLMTRRVDASSQGQLQGATASLRGIGGMIGPGLFTLTFAHFIGADAARHVPGAPFFWPPRCWWRRWRSRRASPAPSANTSCRASPGARRCASATLPPRRDGRPAGRRGRPRTHEPQPSALRMARASASSAAGDPASPSTTGDGLAAVSLALPSHDQLAGAGEIEAAGRRRRRRWRGRGARGGDRHAAVAQQVAERAERRRGIGGNRLLRHRGEELSPTEATEGEPGPPGRPSRRARCLCCAALRRRRVWSRAPPEARAPLARARRAIHDAGVQEQPFTPDADYCAYCHAPAAGVCADCGALCCGDCVEIVMRFTSRRAVCRSCLDAPAAPPRAWWRWVAAAALAGAALWALVR